MTDSSDQSAADGIAEDATQAADENTSTTQGTSEADEGDRPTPEPAGADAPDAPASEGMDSA